MTIINEIPEFQFRGKRDYLHSTSVFDWIVQREPDSEDIDFQFYKLTRFRCQIVEKPEKSEGLVATFRTSKLNLGLIKTDTPIDSSYECNEDSICQNVTFSEGSAEFDVPPIENASFLEAIVAVYKQMLSETEDGKKGKLLFGRVKLKHLPTSGRCTVKHRRKIGEQFFEATILSDDSKIGALYFGQS